ncbi:MAG TPA: sigma-70 family RNA polymerase sigma factor [Planctomycetota bacterium]|nr:sigma-70 family RNA polymerase sigma factor [Planctomycetota bacterium]
MFGRDPIDRRFAHFCRTGDPDALGDVFDHTAGRLMRIALWLAGDRADAEDLLQRTFLQAIETRTQFEPGKPVLPWLMGLLGNQARKLRRDRDRAMALRPPADRVRDPEVEASARELEQAVGAVRDRLGEPYREVLRLHLEQGFDAKEIAERLGRPAGTVRTQLMRALDLLRRRLPGGFVAGLGALTVVDVAAVAAVRTAVMTSAHGAAAGVMAGTAATTTVTLGGLLMAKKVLLVLPVALLLAAVTWVTVWRGSGDEALQPAPVVSRVNGSSGPDSKSPVALGAAHEVATERLAATAPETSGEPGFAALRVVVHWQHDGSAVPGMGVQVLRKGGGVLDNRDAITDTGGIALLRHIVPGTYHVQGSLIDHDGQVDLAAGELRTVEVEANQKTVVAGRVIDSEGRSVAGACLWLSASMNWSEGWEAARSDGSGSFTVPLGNHHYLGARMDGHVPSYLQSFDDASRGPFRDVVLQLRGTAARLHGTVRDARGKAVAWATVWVGQHGGGGVASGRPDVRFTMPNPEKLTTDHDGKFTATGLPPGDVPVSVWATGFGLLRHSVAVGAGEVQAIDLTLLDAAAVTGVVRDTAGQTVANAGIWFGDEFRTFPGAYALTDDAGRFRLDNLPAWPAGVVLVAGHGTIKATARLQLTAGATTEWNPVLDHGRTIRGTVLGPERPLAAMKVGVVHPSYQSVQRWFETGADGVFELQQVGDKPCCVQVAQGETVLREVRAVAPDTRDLIVRVGASDLPTARVRGRILDVSGQPARGSVFLRRESVTSGENSSLDATTGAFTFGPMPAACYRISAFTEESGQVLLGTFTLEPNEDRVLDDFILQATGALEFTVVDAAGQPVDTTNVHLRTEAGDTLQAGILERGKGKATKLQPGRYLVEVHFGKRHAVEVMTAEVEVRSGMTTPVEIRGRPGVQVRIAFRDLAAADPERSVSVSCRGEDGQLASIFRTYPQNAEPLVQRTTLPPGRYQLDCKVSDGRRVAAEIAIRALDEKPNITIDLPAR